MKRPVIYYITAHGYGHGVRSCDILRAFHGRCPDIPVCVVSDLPESFLRNRLPDGPFSFRPASFDVGMVQLDSVRVDVPATLERASDLVASADKLVASETAFLRAADPGLVVADIPAIPLEAAARIDRPRLAVGNFAWDWIYSAFHEQDDRWRDISARFAAGYGLADLLLKLPFSEPMRAFSRQEPIALVSSPGRDRRAELGAMTGCDAERTWVLLSFTSLDWDDEALSRVETLGDYAFFTVLPLAWDRPNIHAIRREDVPFSDVVASVDLVVSKPGFGLLSDCIVNEKPLVYTERTDFIEYPILADAAERYLRCRHIPSEQLYRGDLGDALDRVRTHSEPRETIGRDGAATAARRMEAFYAPAD